MKNQITFKVFFAMIALTSSYSTNAQTQPFPANKSYNHGLMAAGRSDKDASENYDIWKKNFLESCGANKFRVKFDVKSQTVSEGVAYGMLLSAYKADKVTFDGLWNYYKENRNGNGAMNWKINGCSGAIGQNGATDAELDAAMALIVADYQWKSTGAVNYKSDAQTLIKVIKEKEIESGSLVLKPGDMFGGSNLTNASYFAPGYYRVYGAFTNDRKYWDDVASKSYVIINDNLKKNGAKGGLVSDWCKANGEHSNDASGYHKQGKTYFYDAARTPWRIATDYVWYGKAEAKDYAKKCSDFVRVDLKGTKNIKDGYDQNGTVTGEYHNPTFVGGFACAAMAGDNQSHLNDSYADLKSLNEPDSYFNQTLKTLYLFLLSGNFYIPPTITLGNDSFENTTLAVEVKPNPSNGKFIIDAPVESTLQILNLQGSVILETKTSMNTTEINLSNQSAGLYFLKIENRGATNIKKLVLN
jgi:endoglucanase